MKIKRNILLNPGPATTTDTVKMAQVVPDICPREKEFVDLMKQINKDLVRIVHGEESKYACVMFSGSGTVCMDSCLNSLLPEGKKILIINNGAYSSRAVEICEYYGLDFINLTFNHDEIPNLKKVEEILQQSKDIALVYATHNETGTGILNPIKEIGAIVHKYNASFIVDTTSTYAMIPIDIENDNIDFCMSSSQKGLMATSGAAFVIGNREMIVKSNKYPKRSYYTNLYRQYNYFESTGQMHFTPPVNTIYAIKQAIKEYFEEGEECKKQRHYDICSAISEGIKKLGFKEIIKKELQSNLVISVKYPDDKNWDFEQVHDYCYERGFTIYPGKVENNDTFRICSLGALTVKDIEEFLIVFKESLEINNIKIPVEYL